MMKDSTQGKRGAGWAILSLIRFLCSRRGAAIGRASIIFSSAVLAGFVALAGTVGKWGVQTAWARFTAMETNIAQIQSALKEYQMTASFRVGARDRQVNNLESDVDRLQVEIRSIDSRVIRIEAQR